MKILFIGPKFGNSNIQYLTLKKIYKNVDIIDTNKILFFPFFTTKIFIQITPLIFEFYINHCILSKVTTNYDLIYVKSGEFIGKNLILRLKKKTRKIVYFCNDNPFVKRDMQRWKLFLPAAKYYDLIAFQDKSRIKLSKKWSVKKTLLVLPPYQKNIHCRKNLSNNEIEKYSNKVVFLGTWFPERGIFFNKLIDLGLDIKIYGERWEKDPNYEHMKLRVKLGFVHNPIYSKIIQSSKIAICMPSEGNLDDITARSIEIPAIGTLLCATRTKKHLETFIENKEAIFFKDANECFKKCSYYLENYTKAKIIARNGNIKITKVLKPTNDQLVKLIIKKAFNKII